ncbi:hypothetical protein BHE74_00051820 [Ensete ventricosum]|nr:hypothetical protein BHE74_00051820 [Ensete ventricosum]
MRMCTGAIMTRPSGRWTARWPDPPGRFSVLERGSTCVAGTHGKPTSLCRHGGKSRATAEATVVVVVVGESMRRHREEEGRSSSAQTHLSPPCIGVSPGRAYQFPTLRFIFPSSFSVDRIDQSMVTTCRGCTVFRWRPRCGRLIPNRPTKQPRNETARPNSY